MPGVQRSTGSIGPVRMPRMLAFHRDTSMDISTTNNAWYVCGVCSVCGVPGGTICTILNSCLTNLVVPTPSPSFKHPTGVEQGYAVSNLKYQQLLRLRKRGDERITNAKNSRQELPSVSGNSMSGGDIEKDRANADLCTHTPFYSRAALSLHRVKYESGKRTFNESY